MSQRYLILHHDEVEGTLFVEAPPAQFAPPGPYMLIIVDDQGVPSVAEFMYIKPKE